jgi:Bacterial Ig domain
VSIIQNTTLGSTTLNGATGFTGLSYLAPPAKGYDLLTTQASDGTDVSPLALSTILLTNQPPSVSPTTITVTTGNTYTGSIPATDSDFDPLTFQVLQQPSIGSLTFDSSGNFTFSAPTTASGMTTFTVRAFDQVDYSTPATITVQFVAPAPTGGTPPPVTPPPATSSSGGGGALGRAELLALFLLGAIRVIGGARCGRRVPY